ncbi:MAG TPA: GDSL-type esterase/lipase family protein, partial [Bacteroidales bacterium]|nr:GDSL-type esterase/lipase family protein [Bacteroidales bacterium]
LEFTQPLVQGSDTARLVLFHAARDTNFTFAVTNDLTGRGYAVIDTSSPWKTVFTLDEKPQRIRVRAIRTCESQHTATLYGMSLESPLPGVRVDVIGVNGAMFSSYLESEHFIPQLADRHPDLLIISLGTNEAYGSKSYSSDTLRRTLDSLFTRIRRAGITSPVIMTTPPGIYKAYRKKRHTHYQPNPVVHQVAEVIREYAQTHGMAVWDWYSVMGGREAMARWKAKKLTDRKYVHFSGRGYAIQGMLLREALREQMARSRTGSGR